MKCRSVSHQYNQEHVKAIEDDTDEFYPLINNRLEISTSAEAVGSKKKEMVDSTLKCKHPRGTPTSQTLYRPRKKIPLRERGWQRGPCLTSSFTC